VGEIPAAVVRPYYEADPGKRPEAAREATGRLPAHPDAGNHAAEFKTITESWDGPIEAAKPPGETFGVGKSV
jgi:hypothetical protein